MTLGSSQNDSMSSHSHGLTMHRAGFHGFFTSVTRASNPELHDGLQNAGAFADSNASGITRLRFPDIYGMDAVGGNETRPRCVIVNTFIKINH